LDLILNLFKCVPTALLFSSEIINYTRYDETLIHDAPFTRDERDDKGGVVVVVVE